MTLNTVGPTLMSYGSEEQKATFLPQIVAGEVNFAIGYTEPGSGTDLASLQTRAVRDGDEYVINGNKIFTSGANDAEWVWLACRTDPDVAEAQGDLHDPGPHRCAGLLLDTDRDRRGQPDRPRRTTTTSGCRSATWSARRTVGGG